MIHQAGPLERGVQRCLRCGELISDYRDTMVPEGDPPPRGWAIGAFVQVEQVTSFARAWALVDDPPDCPESVEHLAANGKPIDGYPRQQA